MFRKDVDFRVEDSQMTLRRALTGAIGALALVAATATSSMATSVTPSDSTDVDIVVTSNGVLSVLVSESEPFDDVNYSFTATHSYGQLTVSVTDLRGTAAGWTFNLRASGDFEGTNTTVTIPVNGLGLAFNQLVWIAGNTSTLPINESNISHVSTTGQQLTSAPEGYGNGQYDIRFNGDLLVPGDTLVDTYTTTLIVESAAAPN
jgi:hypothetical protein